MRARGLATAGPQDFTVMLLPCLLLPASCFLSVSDIFPASQHLADAL